MELLTFMKETLLIFYIHWFSCVLAGPNIYDL